LSAFAGAFSNAIALGRTILFKKRSENEKFDNIWIYVLVMIAYTIVATLTYDGLISLLPIIAEYIYATALWQKDVKKIRYGTAVMVIFWFVYDLLVQAWPSAVCDAIVFTSTIISIIKFRIVEKRNHQP
ncbi:MAG: YgjV family protein, partial [Candidatus Saccharibacteria bacterium]|nr:YgjV family protein [Candidatus Saccharibacteria bacterium]